MRRDPYAHLPPHEAKFQRANTYAFEELRLSDTPENGALLAPYALTECLSDKHGWLINGFAEVSSDGEGGVGVGNIWLRDDECVLHEVPLGPLYWSLYWAFDTQFSEHASDLLYDGAHMPRIDYESIAAPMKEAA